MGVIFRMGKKSYLSKVLLSLAFLSSSVFVTNVHCEKILFLLPLSTKSHHIFFQPLINALAAKGHEVTVLTNNGMTKCPHLRGTVKELIAPNFEESLQEFPDLFKQGVNGSGKMSFPFQFVLQACHKVIRSDTFQGMLRQIREFDLILTDTLLNSCLDGFIHQSQVPFILVTTIPAPSYISERVGNFLPPSTIPVLTFRGNEGPNGGMGFISRLINLLHFVMSRVYVNLVMLPSLEKVYREYLGDDVPGILEIESRAAMIFMNSHFTITFPRALLPSIVEVGGLHCRQRVALDDTDLEKFISRSSSPHGFIYFSVGTSIDLDNAPDDFIQSLMTAFSKLDQRVVVKWKKGGRQMQLNSTRTALKIPENVWVGDWFPQQDILGHEDIRLFISHGGLFSMQEAVYHGCPVLGIPFGMDQDTNLHNAVLSGYALKLDFAEVNENSLVSSISEILSNSSYHENVRRISKVFRNRPSSPLETALFWTEYVMSSHKHNFSNFMESPSRNMSIFQYYSFDILSFLAAFLIAVVYVGRFVLRYCFSSLRLLVFIGRGRARVLVGLRKKLE